MSRLVNNLYVLVVLLVTCSLAYAAPKAPSCSNVLSQAATDYVNKYHGKNTQDILQGVKIYNDCYSTKLDAMRNKLEVSGRGPLMGAQGAFHDTENALYKFTKLALAATAGGGSYDSIKAAYAYLYALQFRYDFYNQYLQTKTVAKTSDYNKKVFAANSHLQDLIDKLPQGKREAVADAFADFETAAVKGSGLPALSVYDYAISILQSPADQEYSKPPF